MIILSKFECKGCRGLGAFARIASLSYHGLVIPTLIILVNNSQGATKRLSASLGLVKRLVRLAPSHYRLPDRQA